MFCATDLRWLRFAFRAAASADAVPGAAKNLYARLQRWCLTIAVFGCSPVAAIANDWGMGDSNSKIPPSSVFDPVSTPAHEINTVAFFVVAITGVIFLIVGGLLTYSIVRFRAGPTDDGREPPQVY